MSDHEIRRRIHEKALDHFLRFGFSKVTMNEIAEELGMSKKTLYLYFPGKEELLAAVVTRLHEDTATEIETIVHRQDLDFKQKLRFALDSLSAYHGRMTPYFLADMEKHAPDVCKASNDIKRDRIRAIMTSLVEQGIRDGIFRDDIDQELIVLIYAGALQHLLRPDTFNRLGLTVADIHKTIGSVIIEGIMKRETRLKDDVPDSVASLDLDDRGNGSIVPANGRSQAAVRRIPES